MTKITSFNHQNGIATASKSEPAPRTTNKFLGFELQQDLLLLNKALKRAIRNMFTKKDIHNANVLYKSDDELEVHINERKYLLPTLKTLRSDATIVHRNCNNRTDEPTQYKVGKIIMSFTKNIDEYIVVKTPSSYRTIKNSEDAVFERIAWFYMVETVGKFLDDELKDYDLVLSMVKDHLHDLSRHNVTIKSGLLPSETEIWIDGVLYRITSVSNARVFADSFLRELYSDGSRVPIIHQWEADYSEEEGVILLTHNGEYDSISVKDKSIEEQVDLVAKYYLKKDLSRTIIAGETAKIFADIEAEGNGPEVGDVDEVKLNLSDDSFLVWFTNGYVVDVDNKFNILSIEKTDE